MDERYFRDKHGEIHAVPAVKHEQLDPTPVSIPARLQRAANLNEVVRQMVRSEELRRLAENTDNETFDEADDFDVGEDDDPNSPYEVDFEGDVLMDNFARHQLAETAKKAASGSGAADPPTAANPSGDEGKA